MDSSEKKRRTGDWRGGSVEEPARLRLGGSGRGRGGGEGRRQALGCVRTLFYHGGSAVPRIATMNAAAYCRACWPRHLRCDPPHMPTSQRTQRTHSVCVEGGAAEIRITYSRSCSLGSQTGLET